MKTEHVAALLTLNEAYRSDVYLLNSRLAHLSEGQVTSVLSEVEDHLSGGSHEAAGPDARIILSEVSRPRLGKRIELLSEYASTGVRITTPWDEGYPPRLRGIDNPPLVLFARGPVFPGAAPVAIVGTREAGVDGVDRARLFAGAISKAGRTIVSGLALGIDTGAHRGGLEGAGSTIAVLAGHLGHVYPASNRELYDEILQAGAIVSEVSPYGTVHRGRWIERNRITSGLSEAVVVVEFHGTGGTLQQARFAITQGRKLFVLNSKGLAHPKARQGEEMLSEMGATVVDDASEVLNHLARSATDFPKTSARRPTTQSRLDLRNPSSER